MSKLGAALRRIDEPNSRKHLMRCVDLSQITNEIRGHVDLAYLVKVTATFESRVHVTHEDKRLGRVTAALESCKRQITREVFGEFVPLLLEAEHALYNYDHHAAQRLIRQVLAGFDSDVQVELRSQDAT